MSTDLINLLRSLARGEHEMFIVADMAADEIERLNSEVQKLSTPKPIPVFNIGSPTRV